MPTYVCWRALNQCRILKLAFSAGVRLAACGKLTFSLNQMQLTWYYSKDMRGECFVVYVDKPVASRKYCFRAATGRFVDVVNGGSQQSLQSFHLDFYAAQCVGLLEDSPNPEAAARRGGLPDETVQTLRQMRIRSSPGNTMEAPQESGSVSPGPHH